MARLEGGKDQFLYKPHLIEGCIHHQHSRKIKDSISKCNAKFLPFEIVLYNDNSLQSVLDEKYDQAFIVQSLFTKFEFD